MQLSRPPSPTHTVYVKLQSWQKGRQKGKAGAFPVYEISVKKLKKFLMMSVEKESRNGRN